MNKFIRYTIGPDELWLGNLRLVKGKLAPADDEMAQQALLEDRVREYGFQTGTQREYDTQQRNDSVAAADTAPAEVAGDTNTTDQGA